MKDKSKVKNKTKQKKEKKVNVEKTKYDRGQIFVKIIASILVILMLLAMASSAIYSLFI